MTDTIQKIYIDPLMENQEIWNLYFSNKTLKRKYLVLDGIKTPIELSQDTYSLIKQKKQQIMKNCFDRYHNTHRERYNEFYRLRYHQKKAVSHEQNESIKEIPVIAENLKNE